MSKGPLPDYVDAARIFTAGTEISAAVSADRLHRFSEYLFAGDSDTEVPQASVRLEFDVDASGYRVVRGDISISVTLECQRCLGPMLYKLDVHPQLVAVESDTEAKQLAGDFDTVMLRSSEGSLILDVLNMVEDELILGLPLAPRHTDDDCSEGFSALKSDTGRNTDRRSLTGDNPELTEQLLALKAKLSKGNQDKD